MKLASKVTIIALLATSLNAFATDIKDVWCGESKQLNAKICIADASFMNQNMGQYIHIQSAQNRLNDKYVQISGLVHPYGDSITIYEAEELIVTGVNQISEKTTAVTVDRELSKSKGSVNATLTLYTGKGTENTEETISLKMQ